MAGRELSVVPGVGLMLSISRQRNAMLDAGLEAAGGQAFVNEFFKAHPVDAMKLWGKGIMREIEKPAGQSIEDILQAIDDKKAIPTKAHVVATDAEFSETVDGSDHDS